MATHSCMNCPRCLRGCHLCRRCACSEQELVELFRPVSSSVVPSPHVPIVRWDHEQMPETD